MTVIPSTSSVERDVRRQERRWEARRTLFIDMLKSYAAPLILAAYIVPALNPTSSAHVRLGGANYVLLLAGLVMIGLALMFVRERD